MRAVCRVERLRRTFESGASSAIRWVTQARETGEVTPKLQGDDRRSQAIKAQAERILALIAGKPDSTLEELKAALVADGHTFSVSALSWFFLRRTAAQGRRAHRRRFVELWNAIGWCLDRFTPPERANYFKAAGYGPN